MLRHCSWQGQGLQGRDFEHRAMKRSMNLVDCCSRLQGGVGTSLTYTDGFRRLGPSVVTVAAMIVSLWLLSVALRRISVGTEYAVWNGIGGAGTAVVWMYLFKESSEPLRLLCLVLIVAGIIVLKLI